MAWCHHMWGITALHTRVWIWNVIQQSSKICLCNLHKGVSALIMEPSVDTGQFNLNEISLTLNRPSISLFIATQLSMAVYCIIQFQICFNLSPKSFNYSYLVICCKNFLSPNSIDVRFCSYINMRLGTARHFIHCFYGAFASKTAMLPWGLTSTAQWRCCSLVFLSHSQSSLSFCLWPYPL